MALLLMKQFQNMNFWIDFENFDFYVFFPWAFISEKFTSISVNFTG
jgi:hypothetical protein